MSTFVAFLVLRKFKVRLSGAIGESLCNSDQVQLTMYSVRPQIMFYEFQSSLRQMWRLLTTRNVYIALPHAPYKQQKFCK